MARSTRFRRLLAARMMWIVGEMAPKRRLIGRTRELRLLDEAVARANGGDPAVILVAGEAGIGKSALLTAGLERARALGALTLTGHCLAEGAGGYPFAPFVEIFRTLITEPDAARLPALLGPARGEFSQLLPELAGRIGVAPPASPRTGPPGQVHLFQLILGTVERLTREHLLVVALEDLQWADEASRELLGFLVRTVRAGRVLLVTTFRPEALVRGHPLPAFLAEFERSERVTRIDLGRLDRSELRDLIAEDLGRPPEHGLLARIAERSAGNPFYARQLVAVERRGAGSDIPGRLRDVLLARLGALTDETQRLLRLAAVGGQVLDERLLGAVTAAAPRDIQAALREALDQGLLILTHEGDVRAVRFSHVLLQEAIEGDLLPGERAIAHEAFAEALERDPELAGSPAAAAAELARHWDGAGRVEEAMASSIVAADAAYAVNAYQQALRLYDRALELASRLRRGDERTTAPDAGDLFHRAAEAAALAGQYARAVDLGRQALENARRDTGDGTRNALFEERLRWYLWESGDVEEALRSAEAAVEASPGGRPSASRSRALTHQAGILMFGGRVTESVPIAEQALQVARACGALPEAAIALGVLAWDEAMSGRVDAGVARLREALALAELVESIEGIALGHSNLAALLEACGRTTDALVAAELGIPAVERRGLGDTYGGVLRATAASALFDLGRWAEAETRVTVALDAQVPESDAVWVRLTAARIWLGLGRVDAARRDVELAKILAERPTASRYRQGVIATAVELDLAVGEVTAAAERIGAWLNEVEHPRGAPGMAPWPAGDAALVSLGVRVQAEAASLAAGDVHRAGRAQAHTTRFLDRIRADAASTDPRVAAQRWLAEAEATRLFGPPDVALWARAADAFDALPRPFTAAYCRFRQAEAALGSHLSRAAASVPLKAAFETTRALGAAGLQRDIELLGRRARLDIELPTMGTAADEASIERRLGLTPREGEVLRLLTAGRTNREIGEALFISGKTASVHVSNILAKLQVTGRIEAAAVAHRLGLDTEPALPRRQMGGPAAAP
jgi:DNA-binding CsgD family transcriptional regulator